MFMASNIEENKNGTRINTEKDGSTQIRETQLFGPFLSVKIRLFQC